MKALPKEVKLVKESAIQQNSKTNKHISYSQLSSFTTCPRQWYLTYVKKEQPFKPSIHTLFGTAMHTTIQTWLTVLYEETAKKADGLNLDEILYKNLVDTFKEQRKQNDDRPFSSPEELQEFYEDGKAILHYLKKHRGAYFSLKDVYLAGVETLLYQELRPGVYFKGYIDLVLYDSRTNRWIIYDIKTSTTGWDKNAKSDDNKIAQILLYKEFFAKQFKVDVDSIEVRYFIVKRKVPKEADFATMMKRVQEFAPPSGKIKRGQALSSMNKFVTEAVDEKGEYIEKSYPTSPSTHNCKYCFFRQNKSCPDAI